MRIVVSASGRFHSLHLAHQIRRHSSLYHFYSAGYLHDDRSYVPEMLVSTNNRISLADRVYIKFGLSRILSPSRWYVVRDNWFDCWARGKLQELGDFDLFVGWAHCSLGCIRACRKRGAETVVESGSVHINVQERILKEEYERFGLSAPPITKKNKEKMLIEYDETDYIAVPAQHVYDSFVAEGVSPEKLIKAPYGVNVRQFALPRTGRPDRFRLLFVGQIGLQKGVHTLVEAWKKLRLPEGKAELLLVGDLMSDGKKVLKPFRDDSTIKVIGSVRHSALGEIYRSASAFVLPSIQDGMAMVIGEAMASGLPVICSTMSGGSEMIRQDQEGFILPPRDVNSLAEKIQWCFDHQNECFDMGRKACQRVKEFSWDCYGNRIMSEYKRVLEGAI